MKRLFTTSSFILIILQILFVPLYGQQQKSVNRKKNVAKQVEVQGSSSPVQQTIYDEKK
jgi:hypothetical protein